MDWNRLWRSLVIFIGFANLHMHWQAFRLTLRNSYKVSVKVEKNMLKKNKNLKSEKAFTLIEILIVILIIGILAAAIITSLMIARSRARDASFKSTAKSIQTALVSCCINPGMVLGNTPGGSMCAGGENYPNSASIRTISGGNCSGNYFLKIITPGIKNNGNCEQATITTDEIIYIGC